MTVSTLGFPEGGHFYWKGTGRAAQKTKFLKWSYKNGQDLERIKQDILEGIMGLVQRHRDSLRWPQTKVYKQEGIREKVVIQK